MEVFSISEKINYFNYHYISNYIAITNKINSKKIKHIMT